MAGASRCSVAEDPAGSLSEGPIEGCVSVGVTSLLRAGRSSLTVCWPCAHAKLLRPRKVKLKKRVVRMRQIYIFFIHAKVSRAE